MTDDLEASGHVLQLLRDVLANPAQPAAAFTAGALGAGMPYGVVDLSLARQMLGQLALLTARLARLRARRWRYAGRCSVGRFGADERQLCGELFAGAAVLLARTTCQLKLELVDDELEQRHLGVALGDHAQQCVDGQGRGGWAGHEHNCARCLAWCAIRVAPEAFSSSGHAAI